MSSLLRLKQTFYEQGEKPGKVLAWRIKKLQNEKLITSLLDDSNDNIVDPVRINETFKIFYEKLYNSEIDPNPSKLHNFLDNIQIPWI